MKTANDIIEFFKDITFEEKEHIYSVNGVPIKESVSDKIKQYYKPFNKKVISHYSALKYGISQESLVKDWDDKRDIAIIKGNKAHLFGELYPFNRELRPQSPYDLAIMKFWNDLPPHIIPIIAEARMYHKEDLYAGTPDFLLYNTLTEYYIILDYKTNIDIFKNYNNQKMLIPFEHLLDNPYNKYQLQFSYYQILVEQIKGIKVSSRKLLWLLPDASYLLYDTDDYTKYIS